jgi:hypothetical protein
VTNGERRKRITGYALGIIAESGWILALTVAALLVAMLAKVIWR